jgi:protein O-GlcNAc transferase
MRARLMKSFDRFIDADALSDGEAAKILRDLEIDIVVDLKGFTTDARPAILAYRPAPVQVSYLGYPAAMGTVYVDYLVADRTVIPPGDETFFSERIAFLPDCYQVNDSARAPVTHIPSRAEAGLPETGFVFAAFNASYKITPSMFACWMKILDAAPDSLLWLIEFTPPMVENLKREAEKHGIAPERLIFAPHLPAERHLARFALADLFLDTLPCNAHTTASEALWAGVPVLTLPGTTFAGRVASSILKAARLPDLIASSLDEYQAMAIAFARRPELIAAIKTRLKANLGATPLFDTRLFTRRLEAAFATMHARHAAGLPPENFAVS